MVHDVYKSGTDPHHPPFAHDTELQCRRHAHFCQVLLLPTWQELKRRREMLQPAAEVSKQTASACVYACVDVYDARLLQL